MLSVLREKIAAFDVFKFIFSFNCYIWNFLWFNWLILYLLHLYDIIFLILISKTIHSFKVLLLLSPVIRSCDILSSIWCSILRSWNKLSCTSILIISISNSFRVYFIRKLISILFLLGWSLRWTTLEESHTRAFRRFLQLTHYKIQIIY